MVKKKISAVDTAVEKEATTQATGAQADTMTNQAPTAVVYPGDMNVSRDTVLRPENATLKTTTMTTTAAAAQMSTNESRDTTRAAIPPGETRCATAAKRGVMATAMGKAIGNVMKTKMRMGRMMLAMVGIAIVVAMVGIAIVGIATHVIMGTTDATVRVILD
jgi:hypothetical protein